MRCWIEFVAVHPVDELYGEGKEFAIFCAFPDLRERGSKVGRAL